MNETSVVPAGEFQPSADSPFARRSTPPSHRSRSAGCEDHWVGPAVPGTCATRFPTETPKSCWLNGASRLRSMRGLKRLGSIQVVSVGHAFVLNLRRSHCQLGVDTNPRHRLPAAFTELTHAI
jgi:hypothetical protein